MEDLENDYKKNRSATYSHHLINQINQNNKARVESDLTIRAHENYMQSLTAERAEAAF